MVFWQEIPTPIPNNFQILCTAFRFFGEVRLLDNAIFILYLNFGCLKSFVTCCCIVAIQYVVTYLQWPHNSVDLFSKSEFLSFVSQVDGQMLLGRAGKSTPPYSLNAAGGKGGDIITASDGKSIPVSTDALEGYLAVQEVGNGLVMLSGWAADINNSRLPEAILIFLNRKFIFSGKCSIDRPDVVKVYDNTAFQKAGFRYLFPLSLLENIPDSEVRVFAISQKGLASEVHYPQGYKWGKKS